MVLRESFALVGVGLALGVAGGVAGAPALSASPLPMLRAVRVDPMMALRAEWHESAAGSNAFSIGCSADLQVRRVGQA
jgi:hypothetical protein